MVNTMPLSRNCHRGVGLSISAPFRSQTSRRRGTSNTLFQLPGIFLFGLNTAQKRASWPWSRSNGLWELTVKASVSGIFRHAAAHRLVALAHVARAPVQTVIVAHPSLAQRPCEACGAAARRLACGERTESTAVSW